MNTNLDDIKIDYEYDTDTNLASVFVNRQIIFRMPEIHESERQNFEEATKCLIISGIVAGYQLGYNEALENSTDILGEKVLH